MSVKDDYFDVTLSTGDVLPANYLAGIRSVLDGYDRTAAEIAASVTPTDYAYPPGDIRRYGPALDGTTDDTDALTRWASVGGKLTAPVVATAKITAAIPLESNTTITLAKGFAILQSTNDVSHFTATSKTKIKIKGGRLYRTGAGSAAYIAGIHLNACNHCKVLDVEFEGMQWTGVYLESSSSCDVLYCYIHDSLGSVSDSSDICIYKDSVACRVAFNRCFGTGYVGILCQDPGGVGTYLPQRNKIHNNYVTAHGAYGIIVYIGHASTGVDSFNEITSNDVQDITGAAYTDGGAGIYVVGKGTGGTKVDNNRVSNCNTDTLTRLNAPGAITISDDGATVGSKIQARGNTVTGQTQGDGINISATTRGVSLGGNVVHLAASNDGSGDGGATLLGQCLRVDNSSNIDVSGGEYVNLGTSDAILFNASSANQKNIRISGVGCLTQAGNPIRFTRSSSFVHTSVSIAGNTGETASNTPNVLSLLGMDRVSVTGNTGTCGSQPAINVSGITNARFSANAMNSTGATGVQTAGTCTGSNYDSSNTHVGNVVNGGTGFRFELLGATPGSGTHVAGDTVWHSAPAAAASPGAICTAGGSPGTWKAMAAIAS